MGQTPNNFTILNRNYNLSKKKKKLTLLFFSLTVPFLSHCISIIIFSYSLYFSLLFCLLTHSRSSARLHLVLSLTCWNFFLFFPSSRPNGLSLLFLSRFPSFIPFTLFTSSHNKCKPLTLTLLQPKSPFLQLLRPNGLCIFLFFFLQCVQHA